MEGCRSSRRLHVIYFLSRNGCVEHPHLLRVHHHTTNGGVRLRDIKRWLGELRGNHMPDSFSWSYKRKYKTGYVWQDLVDDDLINPISDNEYVLKGSDITTTINSNYTTSSSGESDDVNVTTTTPHQKQKQKQQPLNYSHSSISTSQIQEESPFLNSETSTLTDDDSAVKLDNSTTAALDTNVTTTASAPKASIKSHKKGSSSKNVFQKLITCGGMDTNDSAQVFRKNKHKKNDDTRPLLINNISSSTDDVGFEAPSLGGSHRVFGNPASTQPPPYCFNNARKSFDGVKDYSSSSTKIKRDEQRDKKAPTAACFSVNGPTCSQCGKTFRPEKLHSHMKSCKGMKALSRAAVVSDQAPKGGHGEYGRNSQIGA